MGNGFELLNKALSSGVFNEEVEKASMIKAKLHNRLFFNKFSEKDARDIFDIFDKYASNANKTSACAVFRNQMTQKLYSMNTAPIELMLYASRSVRNCMNGQFESEMVNFITNLLKKEKESTNIKVVNNILANWEWAQQIQILLRAIGNLTSGRDIARANQDQLGYKERNADRLRDEYVGYAMSNFDNVIANLTTADALTIMKTYTDLAVKVYSIDYAKVVLLHPMLKNEKRYLLSYLESALKIKYLDSEDIKEFKSDLGASLIDSGMYSGDVVDSIQKWTKATTRSQNSFVDDMNSAISATRKREIVNNYVDFGNETQEIDRIYYNLTKIKAADACEIVCEKVMQDMCIVGTDAMRSKLYVLLGTKGDLTTSRVKANIINWLEGESSNYPEYTLPIDIALLCLHKKRYQDIFDNFFNGYPKKFWIKCLTDYMVFNKNMYSVNFIEYFKASIANANDVSEVARYVDIMDKLTEQVVKSGKMGLQSIAAKLIDILDRACDFGYTDQLYESIYNILMRLPNKNLLSHDTNVTNVINKMLNNPEVRSDIQAKIIKLSQIVDPPKEIS